MEGETGKVKWGSRVWGWVLLWLQTGKSDHRAELSVEECWSAYANKLSLGPVKGGVLSGQLEHVALGIEFSRRRGWLDTLGAHQMVEREGEM